MRLPEERVHHDRLAICRYLVEGKLLAALRYTALRGRYGREHRPPGQGNSHADHIVRACPKQLGDASVQLIPVPLHKPVRVVLDCVVVVAHGEVLQP